MVGNSTDNSNPATASRRGGGIYSQYALYLANNVITGNTINGGGEDDRRQFLGSNYTTGNTMRPRALLTAILSACGTATRRTARTSTSLLSATMAARRRPWFRCRAARHLRRPGSESSRRVTIDQRGYPTPTPATRDSTRATRASIPARCRPTTHRRIRTAANQHDRKYGHLPPPTVQVLETDTNAGAPNNTDAVNGIP